MGISIDKKDCLQCTREERGRTAQRKSDSQDIDSCGKRT